ncbi:MAG: M28 family peptidase [Balneola sp.]
MPRFRIIKYFLVCLVLCLNFDLSVAQTVDYARKVVNTLASDDFKGRGYVDNGDKLAADFIRNEFQKFGLRSFNDSYYQRFETPVNTFPDEVSVQINGEHLQVGTDFLIDPSSPSIEGTYDLVTITVDDILDSDKFFNKLRASRGKFILLSPFDVTKYKESQKTRIDEAIRFLKYHFQNPAEGLVILSEDKLNWSGSTVKSSRPIVTIKSSSIDEDIESIELNIQGKFHDNYSTQNVIGYIDGQRNDSLIVLIAHYDHLGMLGKNAVFNGANDNASGTAMLLSLAKHYSEYKPEFNTVFIAFGAEELGLIGSKYFTEHPLFDLSKVKFLMNFDLAGTGDEGIQVVNGSVYKDKFDLLTSINEENKLVPEVRIRGASCNSDHCMFDREDVPGFYIYTLGGIKAYHDIYDRPETLPLTEFEDYFELIIEFLAQL